MNSKCTYASPGGAHVDPWGAQVDPGGAQEDPGVKRILEMLGWTLEVLGWTLGVLSLSLWIYMCGDVPRLKGKECAFFAGAFALCHQSSKTNMAAAPQCQHDTGSTALTMLQDWSPREKHQDWTKAKLARAQGPHARNPRARNPLTGTSSISLDLSSCAIAWMEF